MEQINLEEKRIVFTNFLKYFSHQTLRKPHPYEFLKALGAGRARLQEVISQLLESNYIKHFAFALKNCSTKGYKKTDFNKIEVLNF